jgi:hypothetical protein
LFPTILGHFLSPRSQILTNFYVKYVEYFTIIGQGRPFA